MNPSPWPTKRELLAAGRDLLGEFCRVNNIMAPDVVEHAAEQWPFSVCAYYRPTVINICVPKCASVGLAGPAWSWPGHVVDRTPYGVIAHELGHHVDVLLSTQTDRYRGDFSIKLRQQTGEPKLTSYCPDDGEWFAEMFRLFVTNPNLLCALRPKTYIALIERGLQPIWSDAWKDRLAGAPARTIARCESLVKEAA